jgi:hypothetical protein
VKEIKDKQVQSVFGEEEGRAAKSLETLVLLHVVQLAVVIHLVDDQLLNNVIVELRVRLHAQNPLVNVPDLVWGALRRTQHLCLLGQTSDVISVHSVNH